MTRKKGRRDRPNPFLEDDRRELLDELGNVQELLDGDGTGDAGEEDVPVLEPEEPPPPEGGEEQIPLLQDEPESSGKEATTPSPPAASRADAGAKQNATERPTLDSELRKRENPFLAGISAKRSIEPRQNSVSEDLDTLLRRERASAETPARETSASPSAESRSPAGPEQPDEARIRALVDEILAEWMPRLERELRDRLTRYLRNKR